jgi:anti-sigma B factor antagonist
MSDLQSSPESVVDADFLDPTVFACALHHSGRDAVWVRVSGELDLAGAPELERGLDNGLTGARLAVVDLRQLTFMDAAGIHVIVEAHDRAVRTGRRLVLIRGHAQVTRLLDLTGLTNRLDAVDLTPLVARRHAAVSPATVA